MVYYNIPGKEKPKVEVDYVFEDQPEIPEEALPPEMPETEVGPESRVTDIQTIKEKKETGKVTTPIQKPPPGGDTYLSQQEAYQQAMEQQQRIGEIHQAHQRNIDSIDPTKYYYIEGFPQAISGYEAKRILESRQKETREQYLESQRFTGGVRSLPPSATVRVGKEGEWFITRDTVAEARAEWKTLDPLQQAGKAIYVGFTQWPATLTAPIFGSQTYQEDIIKWEHGTWQQVKTGDYKGFAISTATSPAVVTAAFLSIPYVGRGISKAVGKVYTSTYHYWPKGLKQLRFNIKQGVQNLKFKGAKESGRPLLSTKEYYNQYMPGQWKDIPYNRPIAPLRTRTSKFLYTGKGTVPLETYTPIRSLQGRIIDVGKIRTHIPKTSIQPSRWFRSVRDPYWIKVTQPPKTIIKASKGIIKSGGGTGGPLRVITKDVKVTRGFTPRIYTGAPVARNIRLEGWAIATGGVGLGTLEFLEEGIDTQSKYWDKQLNQSTLGVQNQISHVKTNIASDIKKANRNITRMGVGLLPAVITTPRQVQTQKQSQVQIQKQFLIIDQKLQQQLKPHARTITKPVTMKIVKPFLPSVDGSAVQQIKPGQAYEVWVKDRYIVHGKKRYQERLVKLTKQKLTKNAALSLGATAIDNSAARTFTIKPVTGKPDKPRVPTTSYSVLQNKFYKRNKLFIERTDYAIDTSGEIREISARGWIAEKHRQHPKRKPVVNRKTKIVKKTSMNDMKKVLKSYGFK